MSDSDARVPAYFQRSPIAYGLITVVLIGALLAAWLTRSYNGTLETALAANRTLARSHAAAVDGILRAVDENNRLILDWQALHLDDNQVTALLQAQKAVGSHYMDLLLLDSEGSIRFWTGAGRRPEVRDRPYYRAHADTPGRDIFVDAPRLSRVHANKTFFSFSRAARNADGSLAQIAVAILDVELFRETIDRFALQPGQTLTLSHRGGGIIAGSATDGDGETSPSITGGKIGEVRGPTTLSWVEPVGTYPLAVIVGSDRTTVLVPWRERAWVAGALFALGATVVIGLSLRQARQTKRLAEAESRYRALTEQSLIGIMLVRDQRPFYANPCLAGIFGISETDLTTGSRLADLLDPADRERAADQLRHWQDDPDAASTITLTARRTDGTQVELEAQGRHVVIEGRAAALVVVSDITDQVLARRELKQMAYHDPLTGLPNRSLLFDRLSQTIARANRAGNRFALMLIDLDGFKPVNDTLGHEAGDIVLCAVADRLQASLRESDTVARIGGDEFLVILGTSNDTDEAQRVATKLLAELSRPIPIGTPATGTAAQISGSIGIALFPENGDDIDALVAAADAAMYEAKRGGKNRYASADAATLRTGVRAGMFIEWTEDYRLGIDAIDADHRKLFALGNELAAKFGDHDNPAGRIEALNALRAHALAHFRSEEAQMAAAGFPGAEGHGRQHRELERKLGTLEHLLIEHGPSMALRMLKDWMVVHVNTADRQYAEFVARASSPENAA